MTPETWRRADALLAEALRLPPEERGAWLDRQCVGQPELKLEVEELLAADARNSRFLEEPATLALPPPPTPEAELGKLVGPFRLVSCLGAGGMGTVYLGQREGGPAQRVAIKILPPGTATPAAVARFRREQGTLARLAHDRIARFLDAGVLEDGRPYLVLEFVAGQALDVYCDARRLSVEERLKLFLEVCAALSFVHRHLLVHRDLKPENILVTAEGEVKLLDFGIAKDIAEEDAAGLPRTFTAEGAMTPLYASPEQILGEPVSTGTDVYSLGVILCELLSGRSPYGVSAGARFELERAIVDQEPIPPSQLTASLEGDPQGTQRRESLLASRREVSTRSLAHRLAGDLDAIVTRALEKSPQRRYSSVEDLGRDIERFLVGMPVAARRGSLAYHARKWLIRHRWAAALSSVVALSVSIAGWQTWQRAERVRVERDKTRQALQVLVDTFRSADPYHEGDATLSAKDLLDRAQALVRQNHPGGSEVEAPLLRAIGQAYVGLGFFDRAEPLLVRAVELSRDHGAELEGLDSKLALASLQAARGHDAQGRVLAREVVSSLRRFERSEPRRLAAALRQAGVLTEETEEARALHEEALRVYQERVGGSSREEAETRNSLARVLTRQGKWDEALALFAEAERQMAAADGEKSPRLSGILTDAGLALLELNQAEQAKIRFERALAIDSEVLGPDHPDTLAARSNLALASLYLRDFPGAEAAFRDLVPRVEARRGKVSAAVAGLVHNQAWAVFSQGRAAEATELNQRALLLFQATLGERSERAALSMRQLALSEFSSKRDLALASRRLEEASRILQSLEGEQSPGAAKLLLDLGQVALEAGEPKIAEARLRLAADRCRAALGEGHPSSLIAELEVGKALLRQGRFDEAEGELLGIHRLLESSSPAADDWRLSLTRRRLRALYEAWGRPEQASRWAEPSP